MTPALIAILTALIAEIIDGVLTVDEAITALLEVGIAYTGTKTVQALVNFISNLLSSGGTTMAVAPAGNILQNPPTCSTPSARHKGICCAAVTQFGLAQAAQGFRYTSCTGKQVCLACGTKASASLKHPGQTVFSAKRVSCGVSGCPALSQLQGQIVNPA